MNYGPDATNVEDTCKNELASSNDEGIFVVRTFFL
tara:strand:- start:501 stop:605 length:105 start_codon:yes stop_codon:yes gene_type:complete